jgi:uncharacterized small protein (DUF1192 family)
MKTLLTVSALSIPELRCRICALRADLFAARAKQRRVNDAIASRQKTLTRLEAELAMRESAPVHTGHE